jgi:sec-independent protein translocase protein TatA
MGSFSIWHLLLIAVVILVLFGGRGKMSDIMGDFAKGIKSFKKGLSEDDDKPKAADTKPVETKVVEQKPLEQKPETKE